MLVCIWQSFGVISVLHANTPNKIKNLITMAWSEVRHGTLEKNFKEAWLQINRYPNDMNQLIYVFEDLAQSLVLSDNDSFETFELVYSEDPTCSI